MDVMRMLVGGLLISTGLLTALYAWLLWRDLPRLPKRREVVRPRILRRAPSLRWPVKAETVDELLVELANDGYGILDLEQQYRDAQER